MAAGTAPAACCEEPAGPLQGPGPVHSANTAGIRSLSRRDMQPSSIASGVASAATSNVAAGVMTRNPGRMALCDLLPEPLPAIGQGSSQARKGCCRAADQQQVPGPQRDEAEQHGNQRQRQRHRLPRLSYVGAGALIGSRGSANARASTRNT